jgi:hypothetical protein
VKGLDEVLRRKKVQLEVLGKQITQLQGAVDKLRSIAQLLQDDKHDAGPAASG